MFEKKLKYFKILFTFADKYELGVFRVSVAKLIFNGRTSVKKFRQYLQLLLEFLAIKFYFEVN